ncbi:LapA family protein [Thiomicrorhabdus sp. Kp2]|uniref:LapA family protein n=1 Tax=Thiomicrorhabdus sp. Kp2 TaxID=1123518 RepID=UPI000594A98B|nr:LapA family protein [Thiomicrorhabdus sp. Kp2]
MFKLVSILITLIFIITGVTLGVLNPTSVVLDLFIIKLSLPLSVIMAVLLIFGMVIGAVIIFMQVIRLRWIIRKKNKENQKLSNQIIQLRKTNAQVNETLKKESNVLVSIEK